MSDSESNAPPGAKRALAKKKSTKQNIKKLQLSDLFGEAYIDFVQIIYDQVLKVVNEVIDDRVKLLNDVSKKYYDSTDELEDDEFENDIPFVLVKKDFASNNLYAKVTDYNIDIIYMEISKQPDTYKLDTYKLDLHINIAVSNEIDKLVIQIWKNIALVGLPKISKRIKREISAIFEDNIVEDAYIIRVDDVRATEDFEFLISLTILNEEMVRPGGALYDEAKERFKKNIV